MSKRIPVVCFGDSITYGSDIYGYWTSELQKKLDEWYNEKFFVVNKGICGNTTSNGFDRLVEDIIPFMPRIVLVEFGINDGNHRPWSLVPRVGISEFKKNLREFHRVITSYGGQCIFIVNHIIYGYGSDGNIIEKHIQGNGKSMEENQVPYNDAITAVAKELSALIVNIPEAVVKRSLEHREILELDGIHLNSFGNQVYAEIIFEHLRNHLDTIL